MPIKTYCRNQTDLFPINLDDMIKANDPVRLLDCLIEGIDMKRIFARYNKKGASAYDPKMMIKVIFYAYTLNIYSSRKIEESLRSNIKFMWLSGMQTPDHNTINIFRTSKLQKPLKNIFSQIVIQLEKEGLLNLEKAYTDGTKIEANANKYSFVWGKAIQTRFVKMAETVT
jgi:transposase